MNDLDMASALMGTPRGNPGQTTTVYGVASTDSADGLVMVDLGGDTVSPDDDQSIECSTTFKVYAGDEVIVSLVGADGSGKTPIVVGVAGRGDEMQDEIDGVVNYFWADQYGAHVSTEERSVNGANVLLDADSLDIRVGSSNSEADQTVLASFGKEVTVGSRTGTVGNYSQVFGNGCEASGDYSHAEGYLTKAKDSYSHAEGNFSTASGNSSHAEGYQSTASGNYSHAEGRSTEASGWYSHAEGSGCKGSGNYSHAEGNSTEASGAASHAEGGFSKASGNYSHAEGSGKANGLSAHAENASTADGDHSHAEGWNTKAGSARQHVQGQFNVVDSSGVYADIVGNGASGSLQNAFNLDWSGNAEFKGAIYEGGCTPNGETPEPVVRYNRTLGRMEYWDGAAWVACSGGGGLSMSLLWTNPNPTANFAAQTVALDLSGYDAVGIITKLSATGTQYGPMQVFPIDDTKTFTLYIWAYSSANGGRNTIVKRNGIQFETGYYDGSTTNARAIPYLIYGIRGINATPSDNVPLQMKKLWENPSPTAAFAAQTVSLDLSSYDMVGIEVLFYTTGATDQRRPAMQFFMRDNTFVDQITITGRVSNTIGSRAVTINVNGIDFGSATYNGSTSNNYAIPLRIYGIRGIT